MHDTLKSILECCIEELNDLTLSTTYNMEDCKLLLEKVIILEKLIELDTVFGED